MPARFPIMPARSRLSLVQNIKEQIFTHIRQVDSHNAESSDEELNKFIFRNRRSLRLRLSGYNYLKKFFVCEEVKIDQPFTMKNIIALKNKVTYPFFLSKTALYLFNSRDIFFLRLNGGNISNWLENKK